MNAASGRFCAGSRAAAWSISRNRNGSGAGSWAGGLMIVLLFLVGLPPVQATECGMSPAFRQADANTATGFTDVWSDPAGSTLLFIEKLNINTDGTRRSYSVSDFWGERNALNNLCNAMSDACMGLDNDGLRQRRLLTQRAAAEGWPADALAATRISRSIIPFRGGKPCPEVDGFLVSATALHKPQITDVCDLANYVDALVTPAIVLPKGRPAGTPSEFAKRNAKVGDLVVAMARDAPEPVFAVVGDIGPATELGEGSVALNGKLLKKTAPPINYQELRGRGQFRGKGWTTPPALILVFPGTRNTADPWMTPERIDEAMRDRFQQWGGLERAKACIKEYGSR